MASEPAPLITREEVRAHLKLEPDETDDDALLDIYLAAAIGSLDGPDGRLGRSLIVQQRVHYMDRFSSSMIRLPYPPVTAVAKIELRSADGAWSLHPGTDWEFDAGYLMPVPGKFWPSPAVTTRGVRVTYSVGYAELPGALKVAVLMMVGDLYANRETSIAGQSVSQVPTTMPVDRLLEDFMVYAR